MRQWQGRWPQRFALVLVARGAREHQVVVVVATSPTPWDPVIDRRRALRAEQTEAIGAIPAAVPLGQVPQHDHAVCFVDLTVRLATEEHALGQRRLLIKQIEVMLQRPIHEHGVGIAPKLRVLLKTIVQVLLKP
jgi:hypothetical protein